ncbi:UNVERIFIED_CONTAM: hypothetical protein Sradi_3841000 [Sesamum radiatum]|uniref:Uncharacterized protein n=1 Tax=Sesamum radiatum TaxID=300843 RepID=A0AAW2Q165_SESRA
MAPSRFNDNSTSEVSGETASLGGLAGGSADLGGTGVVDLGMGVKVVVEMTCRAWVVTAGVSPAF